MLNVKFAVLFLYFFSCCMALPAIAVGNVQSKSIHQVYYLNIARTDAASALNLLARQTDSVLIYPYDVAKTKQANAIYGYFTLYEAIDYLLVNSGLQASVKEKGSILIAEMVNAPNLPKVVQTHPRAAPETTEIIVIDGIRKSLLSAQDIKKQSVSIIDAVVSEDILKLPDHNAAESIAHLTGVQVSRSNDEVNGIVIRGLPYYTTTYNNRELFTAELRLFTMQDFPSTALSSMEIHKPGTADLIESGLAGLVNLRTLKPFDIKGEKFTGSVHYSYNDQSQKSSPNANVLYANSGKSKMGKIGFLANFSYAQSEYYNGTRYNASSYSPVKSDAEQFILPDTTGLYYKGAKRWRPSANIALQWQPNKALELYYDGLFLGYRSDKYEHNFFNQLTASDALYGDPSFDNIVMLDASNNIQVAQLSKSGGRPPWMFSIASESKTNTLQHAIGAIWQQKDVEIVTDLAFSDSQYRDARWSVDSAIDAPSRVDINFMGNNGVTFTLPDFDAFDLKQYMFRGYYESNYKVSGKGSQWRTDVKYNTDLAALNLIKFGFRYSNRTAELQDGWRYAWLLDLNKPIAEIDFLNFTSSNNPLRDNSQAFSQYLVPTRNSIAVNHRQLAALAHDSLLALAARGDDWAWAKNEAQNWAKTDITIDPSTAFRGKEAVYAVYLEGHFSVEIGSVDIDTIAGVRLVQTVAKNTGISTIVEGDNRIEALSSSSNSYFDMMPSIISRVSFSEQLQGRMSYSQTSTRPAFSDLNPALHITRVINTNTESSTQAIDAYGYSGNANLTSLTSDNYDLNLDYYFSDVGMLSGALFYRDLFGLLNSKVQVIDDPNYGSIELTRPENLGDGEIYGAEFNVQSFLTFLPPFWRDFGLSFNSTYLKGKARYFDEYGQKERFLALPNLSEWTYNAAIFFESAQVSARLSYNYRSPRINAYNQSSDDDYLFIDSTKARDWLDLSISYAINKHYTLYTDFKNILAKPFQNYNQLTNSLSYGIDVRDEGRYFGAGIRFSY